MRRLIFPLGLVLGSVLVSADASGADASLPLFFLEKAFVMLKNLIVTDVSRIIITYILLFVIFSRVFITALQRTMFKEGSNIIANALAGIITIALFFKTRNFLDRFSWLIIIAGILVILFKVFGKLFGNLFRNRYGSYKKKERSVKKDRKREKSEKKDIKEARSIAKEEDDLVDEEEKILKAIDNTDTKKLEDLLRKAARGEITKLNEDQLSNLKKNLIIKLKERYIEESNLFRKLREKYKEQYTDITEEYKLVLSEKDKFVNDLNEFKKFYNSLKSSVDNPENLSVEENQVEKLIYDERMLIRAINEVRNIDIQLANMVRNLSEHANSFIDIVHQLGSAHDLREFINSIDTAKDVKTRIIKEERNILDNEHILNRKKMKYYKFIRKLLKDNDHILKKLYKNLKDDQTRHQNNQDKVSNALS